MVALDGRRTFAAAAFDHVGIQRALHEELRVFDAAGVALEHSHERLTDHLAFAFGVGDALQLVEELVAGIHVDELDAEVALERLHHLVALVLAHETRVDVDAREVGADGAVHECGGNGRVDAARQSAYGAFVTDLRANGCHLFVDDRRHRPVARDAGKLVQESPQNLLAVRSVHDFGVELHGPDFSCIVFQHGGGRIGRARGDTKTRRSNRHGVEVAHPHVESRLGARQESRVAVAREHRATVFSLVTARHLAAELVGDQLASVADAEHRNPEFVDARVESRRAVDVHALGPARQDERRRATPSHFVGRHRVRHDLGIHIRLAHASRDELCVLRAEVHDQHGGPRVGHHTDNGSSATFVRAHPCQTE